MIVISDEDLTELNYLQDKILNAILGGTLLN